MIFSLFQGFSLRERSQYPYLAHRHSRARSEASYFESEADLQDYCLWVLESKGFNPKSEVWVGEGLRADITAQGVVYELKRTLTREAIYQAYGQGRAYVDSGGFKRLVVVGQLPSGADQQDIARRTAKHLERLGKVKVSFIEEDAFWQLENSEFARFQNWQILFAVAGGFCLAVGGKDLFLFTSRWLSGMSSEGLLRLFISVVLYAGFMWLTCFRRR